MAEYATRVKQEQRQMSDIKQLVARLAKQRPPLSSDLSMREASVRLLRHYSGQFLIWEDAGRCGAEEGIHQLRLHIRRLRVLHAELHRFLPKELRSIGAEFRTTSKALGHIRDLDVFMASVAALRNKPPSGSPVGWADAVDSLLGIAERQRNAHVQDLICWFEMEEFVCVRRLAGASHFDRKLWELEHVRRADKTAHPATQTPSQSRIGLVLPLLIWEVYVRVMRYDHNGELDPVAERDLEHLHQLRIDLKHMRYLLDGFRELLGPQVEDFQREVKALLDAIGAVHDPFVHGETLDQLSRQMPVAYHQHVQLLGAVIRHEMKSHVKSLPKLWRRFVSFDVKALLGLALAHL